MVYLSLQYRIALAYIALIVVTMAVVSIYLLSFIRDSYQDDLETSLRTNALLFAESMREQAIDQEDLIGLRSISERAADISEYRVTLTDIAGNIIVDTWTNSSEWGVPLDYEEILTATRSEVGTARRISGITSSEILYVAVPLFDNEGVQVAVVRMGASSDSIDVNMNRIVLTVASGAVVIVILSLVVAIMLARRITTTLESVTEGARAMAAGDLDYRIGMVDRDTMQLTTAFNRMGTNMKSLISDLSSEQEKLNIVLDTLDDGVILVDGRQNVILINNAAERILQLGESVALGRSLIEVTREYEIGRIVEACLLSQDMQYTEMSLQGGYKTFTVLAISMELDSYIGCLITMHDVTERVRVETTRREFVSNVSHELRTPLTAMRMLAETLEDGALNDQQMAGDYVGRIIQQVDSMTELVTDLLALSLLDRGEIYLEIEDISLGDIIDDLQRDFLVQLKSKNLVLQVMDLNTVGSIQCDRNRIKQVLSNLLDNAIKFTAAEGVIKVDAQREDQFVVVRVIDSGVGIPLDDIPHIFERFYKSSQLRGYEGTGLGLAIARHIVEAHGGSLLVESRVGEGSEFRVTLPVISHK